MPESLIQVKAEGFKELAAALRELPKRVDINTGRAALRDASRPLQAGMAQRARRSREAPHLADHIVVRSVREKRFTLTYAVGPSRRFFYGFYLERGTSRAPAHPFARPAFTEWQPYGLDSLKASFWKRIRDTARRLARKAARSSAR